MYSSSATIENLKFFRLLAIILCVLFSTQIFHFFTKKGLKNMESVLFALLVLALPSFSIYYAWTTTLHVAFVLIFCFYSGQLLLDEFLNGKIISKRIVLAFLLVFLSINIYQSIVTALILPFVFHIIITKDFKLKIAIKFLVFTGLIYVIYFIIFKLSLIGLDINIPNRTSPDLIDIPKKIIKFYLIELRTLVANSGFVILPIISFVIGTICFLGFFIKKLITKESLIYIVFLGFVLAYGYSPNILSGQDYFSIRTIATSAVIVLFFQFWFLRDLSIKYKPLKPLILILPILLLGFSSHNQNHYLAGLQHKEYLILKKEFLSVDIEKYKKIQVIIPKHDFLQTQNYYKQGATDEFGRLSSARDWAVKHLFCQLHWEAQDIDDNTKSVFNPEDVIVIKDNEQYVNKSLPTINLKESFHNAFGIH